MRDVESGPRKCIFGVKRRDFPVSYSVLKIFSRDCVSAKTADSRCGFFSDPTGEGEHELSLVSCVYTHTQRESSSPWRPTRQV